MVRFGSKKVWLAALLVGALLITAQVNAAPVAACGAMGTCSGTAAALTQAPVFPATPIGETSASENAVITLNQATVISPISVAATQGGAKEFTVAGISGCADDGATINPSGAQCTIAVTFSPAFPGFRKATLSLKNNGGSFFNVGLVAEATGAQAIFENGPITTIAGTGTDSYSGDGGAATSAALAYPGYIAIDTAGNIYFSDQLNHRIRRIDAVTKIITSVAGNGTAGYSGDGGPATSAELDFPRGVALDAAGNLYIADSNNNRVRVVDAVSQNISTMAATGLSPINSPTGIAIDASGNLYVADEENFCVRKVNNAGTVTTFAGKCGTAGYSGDNGPATSATLEMVWGVSADSLGNVYIDDYGNSRVRKVNSAGIISTIAGTGRQGYTGVGGAATSAKIYAPIGVTTDAAGNVYFSDFQNMVVQMVDAYTGILTTIAGTGASGYSGDGGPAASSKLANPTGIAFDSKGNLYIVDSINYRIREIDLADPPSLSFGSLNVGATSAAQEVSILNVGNSNLDFNLVSTAANFAQSSQTTCANTSVLAGGQTCNLYTEAQPTLAGSITGTVNLTDNSLSGTTSTQKIGTSATGVAVQTQTITLNPVPATVTYGVGPITLSATGGASGNPVTFSVVSGPATIGGSVLTITGAGTVIVAANQAGGGSYQAAPQVEAAIAVNPAQVAITLDSLTQTYTGSALFAAAWTNPANVAVTLTYSQNGVSVAAPSLPGNYTVTAAPASANYIGSATGTLTINKAQASIVLDSLTQTYTGTPLFAAVWTNPGNLAVTVAYTQNGIPVASPTLPGSYTVTAVSNNPDYAGSATGTLTINKVPVSIALDSLTQTYTGSPITPVVWTNPGNLAVTITYTQNGAPVASAVQPGIYTVTAVPANSNYSGSATGTLTILAAH